jgi:hypothetical protein
MDPTGRDLDRKQHVQPPQQERRAGVEDHHGAGIDGGHGADQVVLAPGEGQGVAVEALALHLLAGADDDHGDVGVAGERHGTGQLLLVTAVGALHVELQRRQAVAAARP